MAQHLERRQPLVSLRNADRYPDRYRIEEIEDDAANSTQNYCPILHPLGPFRMCWELMVLLILICTSIQIPIMLAFNMKLEINNLNGIISLIIDIFLLFDILFNFFTAYFDIFNKNKLVIHLTTICKKYIKGWFLIDLLVAIPFEFFISTQSGNSLTIIHWIKLLRIFRFLRIIKILKTYSPLDFDGFMSEIVKREINTLLGYLKLLIAILYCTHLITCIWYYVGYITMDSETGSWISYLINNIIDKNSIDDLSFLEKYSYSWYLAVSTIFSAGYDATYGNITEQWLASGCILIGHCIFAYFVASITSLMIQGHHVKNVKTQKLEEAEVFCSQQQLPRELSRAILKHIRYRCNNNYMFNESELLSSLPPYLQNDIHSYLSPTILRQFDIFESFKNDKRFLGEISLKLRRISCNENYHLFQKGDKGKEIYIQKTGQSSLNYHDGSIITLKNGDIMGEESIISSTRKCTVTCNTFSEFYMLYIDDIITVLKTEYPTTWNKRWNKIINNLKKSKEINNKQVRNINFNKNKIGSRYNPSRYTSNRNASFISNKNNLKNNVIKSIQLNYSFQDDKKHNILLTDNSDDSGNNISDKYDPEITANTNINIINDKFKNELSNDHRIATLEIDTNKQKNTTFTTKNANNLGNMQQNNVNKKGSDKIEKMDENDKEMELIELEEQKLSKKSHVPFKHDVDGKNNEENKETYHDEKVSIQNEISRDNNDDNKLHHFIITETNNKNSQTLNKMQSTDDND